MAAGLAVARSVPAATTSRCAASCLGAGLRVVLGLVVVELRLQQTRQVKLDEAVLRLGVDLLVGRRQRFGELAVGQTQHDRSDRALVHAGELAHELAHGLYTPHRAQELKEVCDAVEAVGDQCEARVMATSTQDMNVRSVCAADRRQRRYRVEPRVVGRCRQFEVGIAGEVDVHDAAPIFGEFEYRCHVGASTTLA